MTAPGAPTTASAKSASASEAPFDLAAAVRAARRAGATLQLPPAMLAMLRAASAAGASSIGAKVAGVVQKEGKEVNGEDGEDEGSGSDGDNEDDDDAELAEDGTVVKRSKRSGSGGSAASLPPASAMRQRVEALGYASSPHVQQVFARGSAGPHLVVVPTSVLANWVRELGAWCPGLKVRVKAAPVGPPVGGMVCAPLAAAASNRFPSLSAGALSNTPSALSHTPRRWCCSLAPRLSERPPARRWRRHTWWSRREWGEV